MKKLFACVLFAGLVAGGYAVATHKAVGPVQQHPTPTCPPPPEPCDGAVKK
jgi:hypothetical protein